MGHSKPTWTMVPRLTSQILLKFSSFVSIHEIWKNWKFWLRFRKGFWAMAFWNLAQFWLIKNFGIHLVLQIPISLQIFNFFVWNFAQTWGRYLSFRLCKRKLKKKFTSRHIELQKVAILKKIANFAKFMACSAKIGLR